MQQLQLQRAMRRYRYALTLLTYDEKSSYGAWEPAQLRAGKAAQQLLRTNMALCALKLQRPTEAISLCEPITQTLARYSALYPPLLQLLSSLPSARPCMASG